LDKPFRETQKKKHRKPTGTGNEYCWKKHRKMLEKATKTAKEKRRKLLRAQATNTDKNTLTCWEKKPLKE